MMGSIFFFSVEEDLHSSQIPIVTGQEFCNAATFSFWRCPDISHEHHVVRVQIRAGAVPLLSIQERWYVFSGPCPWNALAKC